jgi:survival of motor neuron-related-splicing factor 30
LLLDSPDNEEFQSIYDGLRHVVTLSEEVLAAAQLETARPRLSLPADTATVPPQPSTRVPIAAITEAPELRVPSVLPPQVAHQIRQAQSRAAIAGQAPPAWAIGAAVEARYSGDGRW